MAFRRALSEYGISKGIKCRDSLQELTLSNRFRLMWVPGHCGIHGNEEADALAGANQYLLLWGVGALSSIITFECQPEGAGAVT
jgi:hypothetical protein